MKTRRLLTPVVLRWTTGLALILGIEAVTRGGLVDALTLVPVSTLLSHLVAGLWKGTWTPDILHSLRVMALSFSLAIVVGIPLGYLLSRLPRIYGALRPYIESYYSLPIFIFYPVVLAIVGLNIWSSLIIVWLWAVGGVIVNTVIGFERVPPALEKYCASIQLGPSQTTLYMRLPSALPSILTGVKLAIIYSIGGTVGTEFILSSSGIGRAIDNAYNAFRADDMYALVTIVLACALLAHVVVSRYERGIRARTPSAVDQGVHRRSRAATRTPIGAFAQRSELLVVPLAGLLLWWALSKLVGEDKLADPLTTLSQLLRLLSDGSMSATFVITIKKTLVAFAGSAVVGLTFGYILGASRFLRDTFSEWITAIYTIPKIVLYPIVLAFFGVSALSHIAFGFLHAAPVILIFTMAAVLAVSPGHRKYAASIQLPGWQTFRAIIVPSALPEILTGLRLGLATCFLGVLVGEMLGGGTQGVGPVIVDSSVTAHTAKLMAYITGVLVLVIAGSYAMTRLERLVAVGRRAA